MSDSLVHLPYAIVVRLCAHEVSVVILTIETVDWIRWSICSQFCSVALSIQDEAMGVALSAPQVAHYHSGVIYFLPKLRKMKRPRGYGTPNQSYTNCLYTPVDSVPLLPKQSVSLGLSLPWLNLFFLPPTRRGLRGHPFKVLQGQHFWWGLWNTGISSRLPSLQLLLSMFSK